MRILSILCLLASSVFAADWNPVVLDAVKSMPSGGGYSATSEASSRLRAAAIAQDGHLVVRPNQANPSYCSGATYLVLLKVIERAQGGLRLSAEQLAILPPAMQRDGQGVWGRWNANGPGTARLFHELGLGKNFTEWSEARPGDFMKIFWTDAVGSNERGHSVVFLGTEMKDGVEYVRFWSSNKPGGYGEKAVPKTKVARVIFSRLEHPERLALAGGLPRSDAYLASLLERPSSFAEAKAMSGIR